MTHRRPVPVGHITVCETHDFDCSQDFGVTFDMQRLILPLIAILLAIGTTGCSALRKASGVQKLEKEKDALQSQLQQTQQEKQALRQQLNSTESDASRLRDELQNVKEERDSLQDKLSEQEAMREKLAKQRRELQDLVKDLSGISVKSRGGANAIVLEDKILFALGEASLSEEAKASLSKIADYLKKKQWQKIRIEGHTDGVPVTSDRWEDNYHLSAMRAHAVMEQLVAKGISPRNVYLVGFGPNQPVVEPEKKTAPVPENRRVEILLVPPKGDIGSYLQEFE